MNNNEPINGNKTSDKLKADLIRQYLYISAALAFYRVVEASIMNFSNGSLEIIKWLYFIPALVATILPIQVYKKNKEEINRYKVEKTILFKIIIFFPILLLVFAIFDVL